MGQHLDTSLMGDTDIGRRHIQELFFFCMLANNFKLLLLQATWPQIWSFSAVNKHSLIPSEQIFSSEALEKLFSPIGTEDSTAPLCKHSCTVNKSVTFTATSEGVESNSKHDGFEIALSSEGNGGRAKQDNSHSGGNMGERPTFPTTFGYQGSMMHDWCIKPRWQQRCTEK